ncbi:unnamed protein product [Adineta ricciae]|uniref:Xenotropic and polytropic retrovirus receptor 1-like protein n=1 Tax=Adineta ricciae TaxID=249248 RepID=A0A814JB41_ADIRI|nr:unnamed protein product [Adineta ricciae]
MKFGVHLLANLTPEWNRQYIQYEYLKDFLDKAMQQSVILNEKSRLEEYFCHVDEEFFQFCEKEVTKINTFFAEKLAEAMRRFTTLKDEIDYRKMIYGDNCSNDKCSVSFIHKTNRIGISNGEAKLMKQMSRFVPDRLFQDKRRLSSVKTLKLAFSEYYLMLILLQKYQLLNFTGFVKILKKHDKLFQTTRGEQFRKSHIETAAFYTATKVTELIRDVEKIYTSELESGDRTRAMKRLRVPPLEEIQSSSVTFRLGIFIGILGVLIPLLIILIIILRKSQSGAVVRWRDGFHLYRSSFLIILQVILTGINIYGWTSSGVNHILIFEIDPRNHLTYQQLLEIGTCLCVLWSFSFIVFVITSYLDYYPFVHPLIFVIFLLVFFFNPFPILYYSARCWLMKTLVLVFTAAFHPIRFADNWLCNQLTSLELAFYDCEYYFCFYFSNSDWWKTNLIASSLPSGIFCTGWTKFLLQAFLLAIPSSLRFTQCIRRYYDTKAKYPHLLNAGKYAMGFTVAITNSLRRASMSLSETYSTNPKTNPFIYLWIITALINSTYKLIWDVKMDWGLFHKNAGENRFLRDHIIYSSKNYYYYGIVQDLFLRYSWTINIFIQFHTEAAEYADVIGFVFGLLELIRRFSWNFFRLENEHLNNCGRYRAIRDISIKPISTDIDFMAVNQKSNVRFRRKKDEKEMINENEENFKKVTK